ncbi:helix-turn-helix transcriptional regulator [Tunturiibacter gelidoferens]|uniref:DNA-binding NarL/FixJ family response regulator n=3 Tax=Tunturiibacter TaxID=3154218 RepID=A0A7Y9NMV3_9BACT|nr:helix-turn-helix transcriptional regulator [Edaphobacter lichenicola]MBB5338465.1 DNA-binding NarL/FixJ family response regulator [Edaphobacter lichenicola]NYF52285.1 DNA-binding NarL/FixJ family response regulator [Edaphobacter lichenicola]
MAVSISGSLSSQSTVAPPSPAESTPTEVVHKPVSATGDTVKLSQAAQVHQLKQQGQALSQIASNLGISVATVDGYLGVTVPKAASVATAAPSAKAAAPVPTKE